MHTVSSDWAHARIDRAARLAGLRVRSTRRMTGGASSLTFGVRAHGADGEVRLVAKVAPPGLTPTRNRDVQRQARIMRALDPTGVPVPRIVAEDPGTGLDDPPCVLMTLEAGECVEPLWLTEASEVPDHSTTRSRALDAARIMRDLHAAHLTQLAELDGEPSVSLADEVTRWRRSFATVPEDLADGADEVADRLLGQLPAPVPATVTHGDFRLGNMLCQGDRVTALIDWETWSLSDPRVDLGWFLMTCEARRQPHAMRAEAGMPSPEEVIDAYGAVDGVDALPWFVALSQYRAGAMTALILKHDRGRPVRDSHVSWWEPDVPRRFLGLALAGL